MLRSTLKTLTVLVLILCLDVSAKGAAEPTNFDVGVSGNGVTFFTLWMAEAGGFFKKAGLNVQVVDLPGGTRSLQVLLAGKIAATHAGLGPVTQANNQGADLRMIASTSNTIPFTIFSDPNVKTAADLKEGKIGISTFGSEADLAVALALKQLGLNRKDVTVVQIGENATRLQALLAGQLTATPLAEPMASLARAQGLKSFDRFHHCSLGFHRRCSEAEPTGKSARSSGLISPGLHRRRLPRSGRRATGQASDKVQIQNQRCQRNQRHLQ